MNVALIPRTTRPKRKRGAAVPETFNEIFDLPEATSKEILNAVMHDYQDKEG